MCRSKLPGDVGRDPMDTPLLWHIPLSHYSEKARWALDYKRIAHHRQVSELQLALDRRLLAR
jgi:hypothetical protein